MADLTFADSHNMVAYLEKSEDNANFAEIVDFLNASPISFNDEYDTPSHTKKVFANMRRKGKYFLGTVTPLFPSMLEPQAVEGEGSGQHTEAQHTPTTASPSHVETIPIVASSSQSKKRQKHRTTKRKATEISQSSGPTALVADETVHEERGDIVERAATTATSLDAEQGSGNINKTQSTAIPNDPFPQGTGSGGGHRVLNLENIKTAQDLEITNLKKRVKKLKKKKKSRTPQLKRRLFKVRIESFAERSLGDQEDASKQGRNEIDPDEGISWFPKGSETQGSAPITIVGVSVSTAEPSTPPTTTPTTTTITTTTLIEDEDLIISGTRVRVPPPHIDPKYKGKEKMVEPKKSKKKKDQIEFDREVALRLQAEIQAKLDKEERLAKHREEAANIAEWDDVQAIMDAELVKGSETIKSEVDRAVPKLAAGSSKRAAEEELDQESSKRQKTGENSKLAKEPRDKEVDELSQEELQQMMIIVPAQGINVEALQSKYLIIDWEIYTEGTRKDHLVMLWSLVKEKFDPIEPTDDKEREIWVEVHHVSTEKGIDIYMLVEKEYPLSRGTLTQMLVAKLLVDQDNEMSRELLRKIFMLVERPRR
ncbi:hypothetical protein Tco_1207051 [Tanacetum coccineum]